MSFDEPDMDCEIEIEFHGFIDEVNEAFGGPLWEEVGIVRAALTNQNNDGSEIEAGSLMAKHRNIILPAHQINPEISLRTFVKFSRVVRMELSRFEMEPDFLSYNAINIHAMNQQIQLQAKSTVLQSFREKGKPIPATLDAKLSESYNKIIAFLTACDLEIDQAEMIAALEKATHVMRAELEAFIDWDAYLVETIALENRGNHLQIDGLKEGAKVDHETIRFIAILSRIWVKFIDPNFKLPAIGKSNHYTTFIMAALDFAKIQGIKVETVGYFATRIIRPAIRRNGVENYNCGR